MSTHRTDEDGRTERLTSADLRDMSREDRRELERYGSVETEGREVWR